MEKKNIMCFVLVCVLFSAFTNKLVVTAVEEVCQQIDPHIKSFVYDFYPRACEGVECIKTCYNHQPKGEPIALAMCRATSCICCMGNH